MAKIILVGVVLAVCMGIVSILSHSKVKYTLKRSDTEASVVMSGKTSKSHKVLSANANPD